jgi:hypothetical protein
MLEIERFKTPSGDNLVGFFVRNKINKVVAIGAYSQDGFVMPTRKRYARDVDLCRAIAKLTGLPIKWNLCYWGKYLSSGTRQDLMRQVKQRTSRMGIHSRWK